MKRMSNLRKLAVWIGYQTANNYKLSQKHYVALRERIPRPKSLVFLVLETLRYAQGDIFEMSSSIA